MTKLLSRNPGLTCCHMETESMFCVFFQTSAVSDYSLYTLNL